MASAHIEFNNQPIPQGLLDIEQIGECAIEGSNDDGYYYYLVIRTSLGITTIVSCGPLVPDIALLPNGYKVELNRFDYKDDKVETYINKWLNDKKKITEAKLIPIEEAVSQIRDLGEYLQNYSEEVY